MAAAEPQPALATTKRKFHRLLDNLAASTSTTSLASTLHESNESVISCQSAGSPEPPNKRPRSSNLSEERQQSISAGQKRIRMLKEQFKTPRRAGTVRVVGNKNETPTASSPRRPPNFQPYSQEQFLARLKTFADVKKWTNKPDAISEVEWAKRGWSCDTWNTVACKGGCEKRIAVKLRPKRKDGDGQDIDMSEDLSEDIDDSLVQRYREIIVTGHADDCLWKKQGCQEDIYHIAIASRPKSISELLDRYRSLRAVSTDMPLLENITCPDPPVKQILEHIPPTFFTSSDSKDVTPVPKTSEDIVAFAFALFGWSGTSESRISLAVCNHCFQRLGLWLSSDIRIKEMSKRLDVSIDSLRLNLLESHREHCPWKNAEVQGNSKDSPIANMAAWQTLQFILLGKSKMAAIPKPAAHRHTRNVASVDAGSEIEYPRGSFDSDGGSMKEKDMDDDQESLGNKWKKLKAKLKRTASKKSLRSVKSVKSTKSGKSLVEPGRESGKS
ncbi:hypothetical protein ACN47E_000093 [Coniothyrium glycines]